MSKKRTENVVRMPKQRTGKTDANPLLTMRKISNGESKLNFVEKTPHQRTDKTDTRPKRKLKDLGPIPTFEESVLGFSGIEGLRELRDEQDATEVYGQTPQDTRRKMVALARRQTKKLLHRIAVAACSLKRAEASGEQTIPDSLMDAVRKLTNKAEEVSMTLTGRELLKPTISLVPELTMTCSEAIDALMKAYAQLAEAELRELITHA